jgi:hypothetical protein
MNKMSIFFYSVLNIKKKHNSFVKRNQTSIFAESKGLDNDYKFYNPK